MNEWDSSESDGETDQEIDPHDLVERLKNQYTDVSSPIGYADVSTIYRHFKGKLPYKYIYDFLSTTDGYTLTKRSKKPRHFNMTYSSRLRQNLQVDVFFMSEFKKENDNIIHILTGVDVWSRFMWVCPIQNTSGSEGIRGVNNILDQMGQAPTNLTADRGSEFVSKKFHQFLTRKKIKLHHSVEKCSVVERALLTLKRYIFRFFAETDSTRYIDKLQDFVNTYNAHFHRIIQMSPQEAELVQNQPRLVHLQAKRKAKMRSKRKSPRLKVNDTVRISRKKTQFSRGFDNNFHYEVFTIYRVDELLPIPRYYLKQAETDEKISGAFYMNELVLVKDLKFKLTVLKKRKVRGQEQFFVKWKGYSGIFLTYEVNITVEMFLPR